VRTGVTLQGVDPPGEFESMVAEIEDLGYGNLWLTDSSLHSRYCWAYLTLAARCTSRLMIGTAVTNPVTRVTRPCGSACNSTAVSMRCRCSRWRSSASGCRPSVRPRLA